MKRNVLIIGAGGVAHVVAHKCAQHNLLLGDIHVASAMFFDIGVFTLVVGSTLLILTAIAHQSVRGHRYHARLAEEAAQEDAPPPPPQETNR